MANPVIGPSFAAELAAAGLGPAAGVYVMWGSNGTYDISHLTAPQQATFQQVLAAHDPTKGAPAVYVPPTPRVWLERLAPATQAAIAAGAVGNPTLLLWLLKAAGTPAIDVTAAETQQGVAAMQAAGLITAGDAATLLAP